MFFQKYLSDLKSFLIVDLQKENFYELLYENHENLFFNWIYYIFILHLH
jgi:hypothetical protein